MSDYYGAATLEDWLGEEVFHMAIVPHGAVMPFEKWRSDIEANIEAWLDSDDGDGNSLSWRGWGRGFAVIPEEDEPYFVALVKEYKDWIKSRRRVVCAANRLSDGTLVLGARHWDDFMRQQADAVMRLKGKDAGWEGAADQGFIDQWGNFLSREKAWEIAEHQGQIVHRDPGCEGPELYSENLY